MTNQKTFSIFATEKIGAGATWEVYSNVSHDNVPTGMHPEDPFMFVCRNLCLEPRGHCWGVLPCPPATSSFLSSCRVLLPCRTVLLSFPPFLFLKIALDTLQFNVY